MSNVPGKRKNLFLYLALVCFLGIILVFVFDGYMGLYDTATIASGEIPIVIEPDQWQEQARYGFIFSISIGYGGKGTFSYEIDNRRFSSYNANINVSLWRNQEKVADILSESVSIGAFRSSETGWTFDTTEYIPENVPENTTMEFTVLIEHGDTERKLLIYVFRDAGKPVINIIPTPPE